MLKSGDETYSVKKTLSLTVNGREHKLEIGSRNGQVAASHTLAHTLRELLGLTGTKVSCNRGACGACTVLMNGRPVNSCMILTVDCEGKDIITIEGLKNPETGELDLLQQSFIDHNAFQCGFCTPGMIMNAKALLMEKPAPTEAEVKEALSGVFCRCISHYQVVEAVMAVAQRQEQLK